MTLTASPQTPTTTPTTTPGTTTPGTTTPGTTTPGTTPEAPNGRTVRARLAAWLQRRVDAYVANNAGQFGGSADLLPMQLLAVRPSPNFF